jgi:hypothetical protein
MQNYEKSYSDANGEVSMNVPDILEVALDKGLSALSATPSVGGLSHATGVSTSQEYRLLL